MSKWVDAFSDAESDNAARIGRVTEKGEEIHRELVAEARRCCNRYNERHPQSTGAGGYALTLTESADSGGFNVQIRNQLASTELKLRLPLNSGTLEYQVLGTNGPQGSADVTVGDVPERLRMKGINTSVTFALENGEVLNSETLVRHLLAPLLFTPKIMELAQNDPRLRHETMEQFIRSTKGLDL